MSTLVTLRTRTEGAMSRADREFLPAALEILETPPSPIRTGLIVVICAFVAAALGWSYLSRIDIIAVAQGKLQPTGRVKVIQPLETSRVLEAKADNGDRVHRGQVLVVLDQVEAAADVAQLAANLASYRAEVIRREAGLALVRSHLLSTSLLITWPAAIPAAIRQREERVYAADILQLGAQIESLKAQSEQKAAERERLRTMIEAENVLIGTMQERVAMRQALINTNAGSKSGLIEALEALQTQQTTLMQQKGQMAEAQANMAVSARDIDKAYRTFIADNAQKLAEAERQAGDLAERLRKAEARLDHLILTSPIDGTVQASTITTVGQVVTAGQDLMRVVSDKDALEVECYLPNRGRRLRQAGRPRDPQGRGLPVHPLRHGGRRGHPGGARRHSRTRCGADREGRHTQAPGDVAGRRPAHAEPGLPGDAAPRANHHRRRRRADPARRRHGRLRRDPHRLPPDPRIRLLPPRESRFRSHEGTLSCHTRASALHYR